MSNKNSLVLFLRKRRVTMGFVFAIAFLIWSKPVWMPSLIVGILIAIFGEMIRVISAGYIIKTDELATQGPYGYVRHPLYLGSFIMGFGICIAVFSFDYPIRSMLFLILYIVLFFIWYVTVMRDEESVLIEKYGDEYMAYQKETGMLMPRLRAYRKTDSVGFRFDVFLKNREYQACLGLGGIIFLLLVKYYFF